MLILLIFKLEKNQKRKTHDAKTSKMKITGSKINGTKWNFKKGKHENMGGKSKNKKRTTKGTTM